ncbi:MAG: hypothetical protein J6S63_12365 [Atopobiaceae bacterium]|nr:hypothetical protein [Atopobiaceae bacterium]
MDGTSPASGLPTLYEEHLVLGASFGKDAIVSTYAHEASLGRPEHLSASLTDLSHMRLLLFSGADANAFAQAAFAQEPLEVGHSSLGAVLTGDGHVASIPLLARTGSQEYVALDLSPRADVLSAWLSFLANVSSNGYAPYANMDTQDATGTHVVLLLRGPAAPQVLEDYLGEQTLPRAGRVASVMLDRIPCIVLNVSEHDDLAYLVMAPPHSSVALWRSLLSFTEVTPLGTAALERLAMDRHPWLRMLFDATGSLYIEEEDLMRWGLVRKADDFVGARALRRLDTQGGQA